MPEIELKPVKSKNIARVGYDEETEELQIEFKDGALYAYDAVPSFEVRDHARQLFRWWVLPRQDQELLQHTEAEVIKQLDPSLPMITPLGYAEAYFIWADGRHVWYGVFQRETGENWWWLNNYVRAINSISDEQYQLSPIVLPPEMERKLAPHRKRHKNWKEW